MPTDAQVSLEQRVSCCVVLDDRGGDSGQDAGLDCGSQVQVEAAPGELALHRLEHFGELTIVRGFAASCALAC